MKRLWLAFAAVLIVSFLVLGWIGTRIYQEMPPIPDKFVTTEGVTLIDSGEIGEGQNVWQSLGGMQVGSIWGHGSYVAPDWTADWLHREAVFILNRWATSEFDKPFEDLDAERQAQLSGRLSALLRNNTYDESSGVATIAPVRAEAFDANVDHYRTVFIDGNADYAIPPASPRPRRCCRRRSSWQAGSLELATTCTSRGRPRSRLPGARYSAHWKWSR